MTSSGASFPRCRIWSSPSCAAQSKGRRVASAVGGPVRDSFQTKILFAMSTNINTILRLGPRGARVSSERAPLAKSARTTKKSPRLAPPRLPAELKRGPPFDAPRKDFREAGATAAVPKAPHNHDPKRRALLVPLLRFMSPLPPLEETTRDPLPMSS